MLETSILLGDARRIELPDQSVHCVVTSPPYWGLRDYGFDGQIGAEKTPEEYVANLVTVFREIRRVLRDDGTVWLNLGDSFANDGKWGGATGGKHVKALHGEQIGRRQRSTGLKPKDLIGIPWRVAFALQQDGWYLRADIIWAKGISFCPTYAGSSMPESVTDRPSRTHEYVFLLTKSAKYYYDVHAVKETAVFGDHHAKYQGTYKRHKIEQMQSAGAPNGKQFQEGLRRPAVNTRTRNLRSVWTINPKPYPGAHFATFPPALVTPCIKAGTSEYGACATCGQPYKRFIERGAARMEQQAACGGDKTGGYSGNAIKDYESAGAQDASETKARILAGMVEQRTIAWVTDCPCPISDPVPCVVLDPFSGSGTTAATAHQMGRIGIGVEPNPEYVILGLERLQAVGAI